MAFPRESSRGLKGKPSWTVWPQNPAYDMYQGNVQVADETRTLRLIYRSLTCDLLQQRQVPGARAAFPSHQTTSREHGMQLSFASSGGSYGYSQQPSLTCSMYHTEGAAPRLQLCSYQRLCAALCRLFLPAGFDVYEGFHTLATQC